MTAMVRDVGPRRLLVGVFALFIVIGLALLASLLVGAWPILGEPQPLANLLGGLWDPLHGKMGLAPFFVGTATVTAIALIVAVPFALGIAIATARQLMPSVRELVMRVLTVMSAIPSVIFGWWGLLVIVPWVRHQFGGPGFSVLAAGLVLAIMLVPTLGLLFSQALAAVPQSYQEGSSALGATADQTLLRVVIPYSLPGLVQGLLVGVARALGETIAVQMVIGGQPTIPAGLTSPGSTLTTQLLTDLSVFPPGTRGHAVLDVMALALMVGMYLLVRATERWGVAE